MTPQQVAAVISLIIALFCILFHFAYYARKFSPINNHHRLSTKSELDRKHISLVDTIKQY